MKKKFLFVSLVFLLSNCGAIFVEDISTETVVLLAPSNGSVISNGTVQLNWQEVGDVIEYKIQIATPSFSNANQILLDSITTRTVISKDLNVGDYEWRVKASNTGYSTNYSTASFSVN
jgi:hypothetical protein